MLPPVLNLHERLLADELSLLLLTRMINDSSIYSLSVTPTLDISPNLSLELPPKRWTHHKNVSSRTHFDSPRTFHYLGDCSILKENEQQQWFRASSQLMIKIIDWRGVKRRTLVIVAPYLPCYIFQHVINLFKRGVPGVHRPKMGARSPPWFR